MTFETTKLTKTSNITESCIVYICALNWFEGFVYSCTVNWFMDFIILNGNVDTGDGQEYHTDRTLQ